jgi:hypothetical protein
MSARLTLGTVVSALVFAARVRRASLFLTVFSRADFRPAVVIDVLNRVLIRLFAPAPLFYGHPQNSLRRASWRR